MSATQAGEEAEDGAFERSPADGHDDGEDQEQVRGDPENADVRQQHGLQEDGERQQQDDLAHHDQLFAAHGPATPSCSSWLPEVPVVCGPGRARGPGGPVTPSSRARSGP